MHVGTVSVLYYYAIQTLQVSTSSIGAIGVEPTMDRRAEVKKNPQDESCGFRGLRDVLT